MAHYTFDLHTGNPSPFLYTPTSLLLEHSVLTDVQQATGRNGQQWITCRSGGEGLVGKRNMTVEIRTESDEVVSTSTTNSATMGLSIQRSNGLYHCLTEESQTQYFSFFFRNSGMSLYMYPFSHACTEIYETQSFTQNALSHRRFALYCWTTIMLCSILQSPYKHQLLASWIPHCGPSHHQMAAEWRDIL